MNDDADNIPYQSPVMPVLYEGDHRFTFRCYRGISCWNACCSNIDITLTPYDILRLKGRLGIAAAQFLKEYTVPFEMEKDGLAGVKFRPVEEGTACRFMTAEGCSVYEDRPTACRYYPVGHLSIRHENEFEDRANYALVSEPHCRGHEQPDEQSIDEYRHSQGLEPFDLHSRGWRQLILKKKSSGPTVGKPSLRSRQFFFMACYDLDTFRAFVNSSAFGDSFQLSEEEYDRINGDEVELLEFAYRLLKQVMFGEMSVPLKEGARESWEQKKREELRAQEQAQPFVPRPYDPALEPFER